MQCPHCQEYGQELSTEAGARTQPRTYECNTPDCDVMRFDEGGAIRSTYPQPDEEGEDDVPEAPEYV